MGRAKAETSLAGGDHRLPIAVNSTGVSGQTGRLHRPDTEPHETYWQDIQSRHAVGVATPKFLTMDGRCEVPIEYLRTIITIVFAAKGKADTARGMELEQYKAVKDMATGFAAQGSPRAIDVETGDPVPPD